MYSFIVWGKMTAHQGFSEEVRIDGMILARLMPGDDLFKSLRKTAQDHGIERGVILSAIEASSMWSLEIQAEYRFAGKPRKYPRDGRGRSLRAPFFRRKPIPSEGEGEPIIHLHVMLGSPSGDVMGGHLFKAIIFSTTEIVVGKITGSSVCKAKSDVTGLMELLKR